MKLRVVDRRGLLGKLSRLNARAAKARVYERNTLYDTPDGVLARDGQLLRVRVERRAGRAGNVTRRAHAATSGGMLTYKGPPRNPRAGKEQYKVREEREVRVADPETLGRSLERIGLRPWFRYEKYRSCYRLPGLRRLVVELDETPIGDFLELEGDRGDIDRAAARLGYGREDYITLSYGALFGQWQRRGTGRPVEPVPGTGLGDMLFLTRR